MLFRQNTTDGKKDVQHGEHGEWMVLSRVKMASKRAS